MSKKLRLVPKLLLCGFLTFVSSKAHAEITPDNTLGAETSRINQNVQIKGALGDSIEGGAQRGINLFHSFSEFNIKDGQRVYFVNPTGVSNILTRVTGSNVSNILGTMGVDGAANLFLINPNGILFGKNASLDIGGSFVGTTANALQFGNQGIFSATNPEAAPLLTINPSAFLFNQLNPSNITNLSQAPAGINPDGNNTIGLRVPDGKSFVLVGGNINLDGGGIRAYSGRVELAALTAPGSIGLNITGDVFSLNVGNNLQLADISLSNEAGISVFGAGGGDIIANVRNLNMSNSNLFAGIAEKNGSSNTTAGDITLNVTKAITATQTSGIYNEVHTSAIGNAGNININTDSLSLTNGSEINTKTYGQGNAGSININARGISLDGFGEITTTTGAKSESYSRIISSVNPEGTGKAGDINIKTPSLQLTNGAFISSSSLGKGDSGNIIIDASNVSLLDAYISSDVSGEGNGGNIEINVRDTIKLSSTAGSLNISGIYNQVDINAKGDAGDININTNSLSLTNGSEINTKTLGQGNAGNINIDARSGVTLDGFGEATLSTGSVGKFYSRITSLVNWEGTHKAGDINIKTPSLQLTNGAFISNDILGKGDAGNIVIDASDVALDTGAFISNDVSGIGFGGDIQINTNTTTLLGGSQISSKLSGQGNAGNIFINARDRIKLDGIVGSSISGIQSSTVLGSVGNGGNIQITTGKMSITNGANVDTSAAGKGSAGNITVNARDTITIEGFVNARDTIPIKGFNPANIVLSSLINSSAGLYEAGNSGNISINTRELYLNNSGKITAASSGKGNSGNIFIQASDKVSLSNTKNINYTQINNYVSEGYGNGGTIDIVTKNLSLDNAFIFSSTWGQGSAGNIFINATNTVSLVNKSLIATSTFLGALGNGGDINLQTQKLFLDNNSSLFAVTSGQGDAGNVSIKATDVSLTNKSNIMSSVESTSVGNGGNIDILTDSLSMENGSFFFNGNDGGKGDAGDIRINSTGNVSLKNASRIDAASFGTGSAGNVSIKATDVSITNKSGIFSSLHQTAVGNGGNINIFTGSLFIEDGSAIINGNFGGKGDAGNTLINATGNISLKNASVISAATIGQGNAGNIDVLTGAVSIEDSSSIINGNYGGKGNAGDIRVNATGDISLKSGSQINAATFGEGSAGNITINSGGTVFFEGRSTDGVIFDTGIFSTVEGNTLNVSTTIGGNINLNARNLFLNRAALSSSNFSDGNGGDINVNTGAARLDNKSTIASVTNSGNGGDIKLNATDYLLLRRNSNIQTTAGFDNKSGGNGGNISIQAPFLIAVPNENNNISANAFTGNGGKVNINAQSIFGIEARPEPSDITNDITASSRFGVQGSVGITQPEIQPTKTITSLPVQVVDATTKLSQICPRNINDKPLGEFVITGRGSLPPSPLEPLPGRASLTLASVEQQPRQVQQATHVKQEEPSVPIIEAQGWVLNNDGNVELVAVAPNVNALSTSTQASCPNMAPSQTSKS